MSISSENLKLKLLAYNSNSELSNGVISDGTNFDIDDKYLIIVNKAIAKYSKVYMEVEVSECDITGDIRYLPLMVGVSKEPSWGFLNSDYCLGAIYYTKNTWATSANSDEYLGFRISEKFAGYPATHRYLNNTQTRPPVKHSSIGIGVDMVNNTICIFVDGKLFYGFSPSNFNMNDTPNVYFAICSQEPNKHIKGSVRFGKKSLMYLPKTFTFVSTEATDTGSVITVKESDKKYEAFYENLYGHNRFSFDIEARVITGNISLNEEYHRFLLNYLESVNYDLDIINKEEHRIDLEIMYNNLNMRFYKDIYNEILNKHAFKYDPKENDIAYINLPLGKDKKLYFEITCAGAHLINDYSGIPLVIGLTKDPSMLEQKTLEIDLYHLKTDGYHVTLYNNGFQYIQGNYNIENPVYPSQPITLGILIDLHNNSIEIYIEGVLFTEISPEIIDFSDSTERTYFFFKSGPESICDKGGYVICNFGTKETNDARYMDNDFLYFDNIEKANTKSLWEYYNMLIREMYYSENDDRRTDIYATIKVISDHLLYGKNIYCRITIPENDPDITKWSPGLNKLWSSYNTVSNTEETRNVPDKSIFDLQRMIDEDNNNNRR